MPDKNISNKPENSPQGLTVREIYDTYGRPLAERAQSLISNPVVQAEMQRATREEYYKKVKAYEDQAFNLTNKEIEDLIWSIHIGKNTFEDLKQVMPSINSATICKYLLDEPELRFKNEGLFGSISKVSSLNVKRAYYFQMNKIPTGFYAPYEFEPTDSFILTITAENMIDQLEKEHHLLELAEKSLAIAEKSLIQSEKSAEYGKYAAILAFLGIVVSILLDKF
ncbi:hypothetical protein [Veillonella magna]|uniref:hypothetical protein n=1 Tax=Veillonella magna TaxID=464322 RepID=UPI0023F4DCB3|nr:hypothetical protein [Veillonella magna]